MVRSASSRVSNHEARLVASSFETRLAPLLRMRRVWSARYPRRDIGNCLHHGIAHAAIVQRMAGALDEADLGFLPARGERLRGCGRTEQIVAALHDGAGNAGELAGLFEQL